jgi:hypothetical protein
LAEQLSHPRMKPQPAVAHATGGWWLNAVKPQVFTAWGVASLRRQPPDRGFLDATAGRGFFGRDQRSRLYDGGPIVTARS